MGFLYQACLSPAWTGGEDREKERKVVALEEPPA